MSDMLLTPEERAAILTDADGTGGDYILEASIRQRDKILRELQKIDKEYSCSRDYSDAMKDLIARMEKPEVKL